jgi:hypothetical protein
MKQKQTFLLIDGRVIAAYSRGKIVLPKSDILDQTRRSRSHLNYSIVGCGFEASEKHFFPMKQKQIFLLIDGRVIAAYSRGKIVLPKSNILDVTRRSRGHLSYSIVGSNPVPLTFRETLFSDEAETDFSLKQC